MLRILPRNIATFRNSNTFLVKSKAWIIKKVQCNVLHLKHEVQVINKKNQISCNSFFYISFWILVQWPENWDSHIPRGSFSWVLLQWYVKENKFLDLLGKICFLKFLLPHLPCNNCSFTLRRRKHTYYPSENLLLWHMSQIIKTSGELIKKIIGNAAICVVWKSDSDD